jgi:hypothetical protein
MRLVVLLIDAWAMSHAKPQRCRSQAVISDAVVNPDGFPGLL